MNHSTGSVEVAGSAVASVINGTGGYAGISGKWKVSFDVGFTAPGKNGKCGRSENAKSLGQQAVFSATGMVTFS